MKRGGLIPREKPLKRGGPLKRTRKRRPGTVRRKEERAAARRRRDFEGPFEGYSHRDYIVTLPCLIGLVWRPCWGPIDPAHVRRRSQHPHEQNWRRQFPACRRHHDLYDIQLACSPARAREELGIDLEAIAEELAQRAERRLAA